MPGEERQRAIYVRGESNRPSNKQGEGLSTGLDNNLQPMPVYQYDREMYFQFRKRVNGS